MTDNYDNLEIIDEETPQENILNKLKNMPMTYYLVAANILVFIILHLTNVLIEDQWFISRFAKITYFISIEHEYFRLFTAIFTHESFQHILFNCMAIIILGKPVEAIFGKWKFLIIFIVSGLFGSLSSFIFSSNAAIGASGGVFGIFGVHIYLFMKNKKTYLSIFGKDIFQLLIINVFIGFVLPNIDYFGHFGGIVGGFLATASLGLTHSIKLNRNFVLGMFATIIVFMGSFYVFNNNYKTYQESVDQIVTEANQAIQSNDLDRLIDVRDTLVELTPKLPPIEGSDNLIEQMDDIINQFN